MPARLPNTYALRYPREEPPRRRARWPWLIVLALLLAAVYFTLREQRLPVPLPFAPTPQRLHVGIIAGHLDYDSGAICPDGLREVDLTTAVARQVVDQLRARGYDAEVLGEYADRLKGYRADALVSVHVDSCMYDLSGYKCVGSELGSTSRESAVLSASLTQSYAAATGLGFHASTITPDMTNYHAFEQIDPRTPAAIIELGFMSGDRTLLVTRPDRAARGLVDGLVAFLNAGAEQKRTPTAKP